MIIWWDQICGASFISWRGLIRLFFIILTYPYRLFFALRTVYVQKQGQKKVSLPVISVGNISVGGTGKSVFTRFVVRNFSRPCAGILLRGYGRRVEQHDPVVVSRGKGLCIDSAVAGDEAAMYAALLSVPIVVGRSRAQAAALLLEKKYPAQGYLLLDDGYQHFSLHKNCNILLLDARHPFENGWCLPAGRLREYDLQRADIIILTHADFLLHDDLAELKRTILQRCKCKTPIFTGKHIVRDVRMWRDEQWHACSVQNSRVAALAAIGSFDQFISSIQGAGGFVCAQHEFPDHHRYKLKEIEGVLQTAQKARCSYIVTTTKDWPKILPLLHLLKKEPSVTWAVLDIEFMFLTIEEQTMFLTLLESACQNNIDKVT